MQMIAREAARQQRLAETERRRYERDQLRQQREQVRIRAQMDKDDKYRYQIVRAAEAEERTQEIAERIESLQSVLAQTLVVDDTISFKSLLLKPVVIEFKTPPELEKSYVVPNRANFLMRVRPMTLFERIFSRTLRYETELQKAEQRYSEAVADIEAAQQVRLERLMDLRAAHDARQSKEYEEVNTRNVEVEKLDRDYGFGEPAAVLAYCTMVLERSQYPEGFPQDFRLAYVPTSKELVIDYELPTVDVVPSIAEYRYVRSKDAFEEKTRKFSEIREVYQDVVAAVALRTIHEVFEADQGGHLQVTIFNGFVRAVDPATGKDIKPYLISVRTTKDVFEAIDLSRINKRACLRNLGAQVSAQPDELQPVKPLIDFEMVDKRFVEGNDVLAELESRPNLMDLTPFEFEHLVGNLFSRMGLETRQTRSSRDGGVDVVAWDMRPLVGGKVVIQAKRYRNTVGVSAVRDLYGTMQHEGANKGILVSTSSYGVDAYEFIKGKPIELIDGGGLLYYLEHNSGMKARIIFPSE